ncbi:MAG: ATP-binding protein, partial [Pyrobaculum sp.]
TENKVKLKISSLGLDPSRYIVLDYVSISDTDILFSNVVEKFYEYSPDVVILDGINALPQSREAASLLYRVFQTPTIAIGEEHLGASHFAYVADTLLEWGSFSTERRGIGR